MTDKFSQEADSEAEICMQNFPSLASALGINTCGGKEEEPLTTVF